MDGRVADYVQGQDKMVYFTAQGITYSLSGKAAKSTTAKPLVFAAQSAARIIAAPEALSWKEQTNDAYENC